MMFEYKTEEIFGILTDKLEFRVMDHETPLVYGLSFATEEEKATWGLIVTKLIADASISGGLSGILSCPKHKATIIGSICEMHVTMSSHFALKLKLKLVHISLYDGDDKCFPYACGKVHH